MINKTTFVLSIILSFFIIGKASALEYDYSKVDFDKNIDVADKIIKDYSSKLDYYSIFFRPGGYIQLNVCKKECHLYINNSNKIILKPYELTSSTTNYQSFYIGSDYESIKNNLNQGLFYGGSINYNASSVPFGWDNNWYLYYSNYDLKYLGSAKSEDYILNGKIIKKDSIIKSYSNYLEEQSKIITKFEFLDTSSLISIFMSGVYSILFIIFSVLIIRKIILFFINSIRFRDLDRMNNSNSYWKTHYIEKETNEIKKKR